MAEPRIVHEGANIVVRGRFNPAIFSPRWFRDEELIGDVEYDAAKIEIISPRASIFELGWARVHVSEDTFQVATEDADEFERLRDIAVGVLKLLRHTPLMALGINRDFHVQVEDFEALNRIGDAITPKNIWEPPLKFAGMRSVTMWGSRTDLYGGHLSVQVEPSMRVPNGVFIAQNDHYDLTVREAIAQNRISAYEDSNRESELTSSKIDIAIDVLGSNWSESLISAERVVASIEKLAES